LSLKSMNGCSSALILLMVGSSLTRAAMAWQAFYPLGRAEVTVCGDGSVLISDPSPSNREKVLEWLGPDGLHIAEHERVLFVDSDGWEWILKRHQVVCMDQGRVVTKRQRDLFQRSQGMVESASGLRWIILDGRAHTFDGTTWMSSEPLDSSFEGRDSWWSLAVSPDGNDVYAWRSSRPGVWRLRVDGGVVLAGSLGPRAHHAGLNSLLPLDEGRVVVMPGYRIIGEEGRYEPPQSDSLHNFRQGYTPFGDFVLGQDSYLVPSHGSVQLIAVRDCSRRSVGRIFGHGINVLIWAETSSGPERALPVEEAFEPTYVDHGGRLWRAPGQQWTSLSFLKERQAMTLVDSGSREPVAVRSFAGVDGRGRCYFRLSSGEAIAFDPEGARAETAGRVDAPRLDWEGSPVELWTPEREQVVRELIEAEVRSGVPGEALRLARRMERAARLQGNRLHYSALWRALPHVLDSRWPGDEVTVLAQRARAASMLGLGDVASRVLDEAWSMVQPRSGLEGVNGAIELAASAEASGRQGLAVDAYVWAEEQLGDAVRKGPHWLESASRCAAVIRHFDLAVRWFDLRVSQTGLRLSPRDRQRRDSLRAYASDPDSVEAALAYLGLYWELKREPRWQDGERDSLVRMLEDALDRYELPAIPRRQILRCLLRTRAAQGRWDEAQDVLESLRQLGPAARRVFLESAHFLAEAQARSGLDSSALAVVEILAKEGEGAVFEHRAAILKARVLADLGRSREAYETARPILPLTRLGVLGLHGLTIADARALALVLVDVYEDLGKFEEALKTAEVVSRRFPSQRRMGHSHARPAPIPEDELRVQRLKALVEFEAR
ncbi:MAG: tetratricopeptide repeat protein, partial [Planctomycetota bacterium]